jgi:hypothetical protein
LREDARLIEHFPEVWADGRDHSRAGARGVGK